MKWIAGVLIGLPLYFLAAVAIGKILKAAAESTVSQEESQEIKEAREMWAELEGTGR